MKKYKKNTNMFCSLVFWQACLKMTGVEFELLAYILYVVHLVYVDTKYMCERIADLSLGL